MKLTKENIQFIDTYLKNSDVIYIDIRQEMLDHIASGVEQKMATGQQDFYDAFKEYMVVNKSEILKNNRNRSSFSWDVIRQFLLFLVKPYSLGVGVLLFMFFKNVDVNLYFSEDFTVGNLFFVLLIGVVLFQLFYFYIYLKKRFYAIEKTGAIWLILYYLQLFFLPAFGTNDVSAITLTISSFLFLGYVVFFIQELVKFHKHRFNYI